MSGTAPSQAGFLQWVRDFMAVPTAALPDDSIFIGFAYDLALATVNPALAAVPPIYTLAVYNLGGDFLVNWCQDVPPSTYWADLRTSFAIFAFAPGVVTSSSDNGTSTSLLNPEQMKDFTLANLQNLKTPYGRQYLAWAQAYGPLWGLS